MKKLLTRTLSGAVYVALIVFGIYARDLLSSPLLGYLIFAGLMLFVAVVGTCEVYHNLELSGRPCDKALGLAVAAVTFIGLAVSNFYNYRFHGLSLQLQVILVLVPVWGLVPLAQLWRREEDPFGTVARTWLPLVWVVVPLLTLLSLGNRSLGLLMMTFLCTWANDTGAYLCGMALGRHKFWPRHSPNKTWEGTVGGGLVCVAVALFVGPLLVEGLAWWYWALIGLICSVMGTLGDLVESMFKRACGVKDSGRIMPGHGGILDRFDSILFIGPVLTALISLGLII